MKKSVLFFSILISALVLSGCTTQIRHDEVLTSPTKLERGQKIYVAVANDGSYGSNVFAGSGMRISHTLAACLRPGASDIKLAPANEPIDKVLESAKNYGARYAVIPTITNWEQRAAAWSGRPTRAAMIIVVHDIAANKQILSNQIDVKGRSVTFVSQSVDELAQKAIVKYCDNAF